MTLSDGDAVEPDRRVAAIVRSGGQARGEPGKTRLRRNFITMLAAIVGVFASVGMFAAIGTWQEHVKDLDFANLASDNLQTINSGLSDATGLLYALRADFESREQLPTRAEYEAFAQSLRQRVPGLRDTSWAPRVTAGEREAFETGRRTSGEPQFEIRERNAAGALVPAGDRDEYFPILYPEPFETARPVLGFDMASEARRRHAIDRALVTGEPAATPPVKMIVHMRYPSGGFISVIAVKRANGSAGDPPAGIVVGAFETAAMFENILATKVHLVGLDMYVFDPNAIAADRLIYWHSADGKPAPAEASLLRMRHWQGTLELVDQRWGVIFTPSRPSADGAVDSTAAVVLISGLSMTGLLVVYLWSSHRRTLRLERLTSDLHETTEELRRNGAALDHLARHDALTGLANRMAFRDEVASCLRRDQALAVLYLDLDRFKIVNDTLGHPAGDRLLCEIANRLRSGVRAGDIITRLGGDEFAIAQSGAEQPASAEALARRLIEVLSRPCEIDGQLVAVGVSVGITLGEQNDIDVDDLLRRADHALYAAKREGRGTWRFFVASMESDAQARRSLEMDLRRALEQSELALYYQPQVTLADGRINGFEALLRWYHPDRGVLLPNDFLHCAEETGLMVPIGAWVLRSALRQAAEWPDEISVAINLSPTQVARDDLVETVEAALLEFNLPGRRVEFEVKEQALIEHGRIGHTVIRRLQDLGARISLDNFGNSYASLRHLRSFPFDRVKMDQSFVSELVGSTEGAAILRAFLSLVASLGIGSLAEGVETETRRRQLAAFGCDSGQGFLFSPPQPSSAIPRMLEAWSPARGAVSAGLGN